MSASDIGDLKLLKPADPVAIADYLDNETAEIDAFIADLGTSVALVKERMSAELEQLVWSRSFEVVPLRRFMRKVDQGVSPIADAIPAGPGEAGVLKAGCTNDGVFMIEANKRLLSKSDAPETAFVHEGDLIVTRASGSTRHVGSAAIVPKLDRRLAMSDKHYRLWPTKSADATFLQIAMQTARFRGDLEPRISGAAGLAKNISIAQLLSAGAPNMPLSIQRDIAATASLEQDELSIAIADINVAITLAKERRAALITAAVTGQFDVTTRQQPAVDSIQSALQEAR